MPNKKVTKKDKLSPGSLVKKRVVGLRDDMLARRKNASHQSFSLSKKYPSKDVVKKISGSIRLLRQAFEFYRANWKIFAGLSAIYLVFLWLIIGLPNQQAYGDVRALLAEALDGNVRNVIGIGTLVVSAIGGVAVTSQTELQQFLTALAGIIFWLIFVWSVRHIQAGNSITIRQALYNATTPLVPFLVILAIIVVQLVPALIGAFVLQYVFATDELGISGVEAMMFSIGAALLVVVSIYWLLQSLFALIIVTLPNMYPLAALASAKTLIKNKRFLILRRFLSATLIVSMIWIIAVVPVVLVDTYLETSVIPLVPLFVDLLSALTLPIAIIYLYRLYRELL